MQGLVLFCVFIFPPGFLCGPKECPSCIAGVSGFGLFLLVSSILTLLHMDRCVSAVNQVPISFTPILHLQRVALYENANEIWNDLTKREVNEHQLKHISCFPIELHCMAL